MKYRNHDRKLKYETVKMAKQKDIEIKLDDLKADTLSKYLPLKISKWVLENIKFEYQNGACAIAYHKMQFVKKEPFRQKPIKGIVLLCDNLLKESPERQRFIILHEIAHFRLKHHGMIGKTLSEEDNEADELAKEWLERGNKQSNKSS